MPSDNRKQVRVPARLWDEMQMALDQALGRIESLNAEIGGEPDIVTRQVYDFGQRTLREARRRSHGQ